MRTSPSLKNSTTVRSRWRFHLTRYALHGLDALAPWVAARVATHLMFRTRRRPMEPWERELRPGGERLFLDGASGKLALYRWGQGPIVLLMHGWNGRASQMSAFVAPLVRAGFQAVAFDAPGHGASAGARSSLLEFADAFERVVDAVRPFFRPLHGVIAHSMAGPAVTFALGRASAAWRPSDGSRGDSALEYPRLVFIAPPIDLGEMVAGFSAALGLGGATRAAIGDLLEKQFGTPLPELHALRFAARMRSPLLVMHDHADRAVPIENGRRLAAAWPQAELCVTEGLGHTRILRDETAVTRAVDFIR